MSKSRIMIVEDIWIVANDIKDTLENLGYAVTSIQSNGENAIDKAEEDRPDLILMDIVLSGEMDGIQTAEKIHSKCAVPIIYLTAYSDEDKLQRAKITEPFGYIIKPYNERELYCNIEIAFFKLRMEKEIQMARDALQQLNERLELTVSERTKELTLTIEHLRAEIAESSRLRQALETESNERVRAQVELREKELVILQQSRFATMGEMVANIAHQWRQPLNILGLIAQELMITYKMGNFTKEYLVANVNKMMETIQQMSRTIDDFRNFFSPNKEKRDFKVTEVITKTLSLLEASLKQQRITTEIEPKCDRVVNGYPQEFTQVLLNLLNNAKDAFLAKEVGSPAIKITVCSEGSKTVVTIADNAGGIPEDIIQKIFDPYFTTKGPDKGTGVGLYMSKIIIEKSMNGRLSVRNVCDGAEFRIEF